MIITECGEVENNAYFVLGGVQRAFFIKDDIEYIVAFSFEGSFSGVVDSFFSQTPSEYKLKTFTNSLFLKSSYELIHEVAKKIPAFDHFLR